MKIGLLTEKLYPYLLGAIGAFLFWKYGPIYPDKKAETLSAAISFGAIITGFMATSLAVLISLQGSSVIKYLHDSGYIKEIVSYIRASVWFPMLFSVTSIGGFFGFESEPYKTAYWTIWIFLLGTSFFALVRIIKILLAVVRHFKS